MTANQIFGSVQALPCTHTSIIPGLDTLQCKSCRRTWPSWHPDFNRLLNQSTVTPEQRIERSGVEINVTPEQRIERSGVEINVTPEQRIERSGVKINVTPEQRIERSGVEINVTPEQRIERSGVEINVTPEHNHWVETYSPSNRKNYSYYRYVWMRGQKMHHVHLPGGNTGSVRSSARASEVKRWITLGRSPQLICGLIKSWR